MANTLDSIIDYLADAVVKDSNGDATVNDLKLQLDTSAAAGTTDGDLYATITALGWESDVVDALSNVIAKKAFTKLMQNMYQGADPSKVIDYNNAYSVTPSRNGWLVASADTDSGVTIAPIIRILSSGTIMAEQTGITYQGSAAFVSCFVKKGVTYTIETFRCSRTSVRLF